MVRGEITEQEMKEQNFPLLTFEAISKFKSVNRAMRRGHVSPLGILYPKRPFNNRKDKPLENIKKEIYNGIKRAQSK